MMTAKIGSKLGESVAVATTRLRVRMSPTQCCSRHWLLSTISPNAHGSSASRMRMVAALAVRSVAPRLRDPCASVRPVWAFDVCRLQFFACLKAGSASRFFCLGRVREVLYDVFLRVLRGSISQPRTLSSFAFLVSLALRRRYSVQLRNLAARARERAAFEPAEPCCKRRGARRAPSYKITACSPATCGLLRTPSAAVPARQSLRDATRDCCSTFARERGAVAARERVRDDARHSTIVLLAGQY